jgi:hypothetical protein
MWRPPLARGPSRAGVAVVEPELQVRAHVPIDARHDDVVRPPRAGPSSRSEGAEPEKHVQQDAAPPFPWGDTIPPLPRPPPSYAKLHPPLMLCMEPWVLGQVSDDAEPGRAASERPPPPASGRLATFGRRRAGGGCQRRHHRRSCPGQHRQKAWISCRFCATTLAAAAHGRARWGALLGRAREFNDLAGAEHAHLEGGARRHAGQPVANLFDVVLRHNGDAVD